MTTKEAQKPNIENYVDVARSMDSFTFGFSPSWRDRVLDDVTAQAYDGYDGDRPDLKAAIRDYLEQIVHDDATALLNEHELFIQALSFLTGYDYLNRAKD